MADSTAHCQRLDSARELLLSALLAQGMNPSAQFTVTPLLQPSAASAGPTVAEAPVASVASSHAAPHATIATERAS